MYYFKNNLFNRNSCVSGPLLRILGFRPLSIIISIIKMISRPGSSRLLLPALGLSGSSPSRKGYRGVRAWAGGAAHRPSPPAQRGKDTLAPAWSSTGGEGPWPAGPTEGTHWGPVSRTGVPSRPAYNGFEAERGRQNGGARRQEDCRAQGSRTRVTEALGWGCVCPYIKAGPATREGGGETGGGGRRGESGRRRL